jgi:hypothetical protein
MANTQSLKRLGVGLGAILTVAVLALGFVLVARERNTRHEQEAARMGTTGSLDEMLAVLETSDSGAMRAWAAYGVRRFSDPRGVQALLKVVAEPTPSVLTENAVSRRWRELTLQGPPARGTVVQARAIESLGIIADHDAIPGLLAVLENDGAKANHAKAEQSLAAITGQTFQDRASAIESAKAWRDWWGGTNGRWRATRLNVARADNPLSVLTTVGLVTFPDEGSDGKSMVVGCRGDQRVAVSIDWGPGVVFNGTVGIRYQVGAGELVSDAWQGAGSATYRDDGRMFVGELLRSNNPSFHAEVASGGPGSRRLVFKASLDGLRDAIGKVKCRAAY